MEKKDEEQNDTLRQVAQTASQNFAHEIQEKVNFLFTTFHKTDGSDYVPKDIEDWSKSREAGLNTVPIEKSWIYKIRHGQGIRPSLPALRTISSFFNVDPSFWVKPLNNELKQQALLEGSGERVRSVAVKLSDLSPQGLEVVANLIESIRNSGLDKNNSKDA